MTKRALLFLIFAVLPLCSIYAQTQKAFEVGFRGDAIGEFLTKGGGTNGFGGGIYAEHRWYKDGFDAGIKVSAALGDLKTQMSVGGPVHSSSNRASVQAVVDYNILQGHKISPYLGFAAGIGRGATKVDGTKDWDGKYYCDLTARVGIQVGEHLRLSYNHDFALDGKKIPIYSTNSILIGWAF